MNQHSIERFYSKHVDDEFMIHVSMPNNLDKSGTLKSVYLLDAQWYFNKAARAILHQLVNKQFPPIILIGLAYPEKYNDKGYIRHRARDFTFPAFETLKPDHELSGHADKFTSFLVDELIPMIESRYTIDPKQRSLFGHSLGGFYSLFHFMQYPDSIFHQYVAANVSYWWADEVLFTYEEEMSHRVQDIKAKVFIADGEGEGADHVAQSQKMMRRIKSRNYENLQTKLKIYGSGPHRSAVIHSLIDGLRFFLKEDV